MPPFNTFAPFFRHVDKTVAALRELEGDPTRVVDTSPAVARDLAEAVREWPTLYPQWTSPLEDYESDRYGPLLGVSDEGSAGPVIAQAAYATPKSRVHPKADAMVAGIIIDGERMTSAGEVPIGPKEYAEVVASAFGRTMCTTNVGVRTNARFFQINPELEISADPETIASNIFQRFAPFIATPDRKPRPLTVRLLLKPGWNEEAVRETIRFVEAGRAQGKLLSSDVHRLSLLLVFDNEIQQTDEVEILRTLTLAESLRLPEVAIDGELLEGARRRLSVPSLLNVLNPDSANRILAAAKDMEVVLGYRYAIDTPSVARTIWTGLHTARTYGLTAAKYGLVPLTLEEQIYVAKAITEWTKGWTAIPAFYVDAPLVTATGVYGIDHCREAALVWIQEMRKAGVRLVLLDSPDRVAPRRLIRDDASDTRGVLSMEDVKAILEHARSVDMRVLWSGGITLRQASALAGLSVFGIFTTSSTASQVPVSENFVNDPVLAAENEPTETGVRRVHALIQAGFLSSRSAIPDAIGDALRTEANTLIDAPADRQPAALEALEHTLCDAWTMVRRMTGDSR